MGKHLHILNSIDTEARTADCATCGPVKIHSAGLHWRCAESVRVRHATRPRRTVAMCSQCHTLMLKMLDKLADDSKRLVESTI